MMLLEQLLHLIESLGWVQPFERENLGAVGLYRQLSARARWLAIDYDGTSAACPLSTSNFQGREAEMFAQEIAQKKPVVYAGPHRLSIYGHAKRRLRFVRIVSDGRLGKGIRPCHPRLLSGGSIAVARLEGHAQPPQPQPSI
jgi:hypothetical protein